MVLVIALGVLAAFLFAAAGYLQQRAARTVVAEQPRAARVFGMTTLMHRLLRSGTWLRGWITNLAGFLTQAAALHLGSVAAVQPLMSTQLLFAVPLEAFGRRRRPRGRDIWFALLVCAGLGVLFGVGGVAPLEGDSDRGRVLLATFSAAGLVALLALISIRCPIWVAANLVAVAAGVCFAMSAVFMKLTTEDLIYRGIPATAGDWPGYLLAVSTLSGLVLEQTAFAAGPLPWAIAAMSVTNPIVSYVVGVLAFKVALPHTAGSLAGVAVAGALIAAGIGGLAHSPLARAFYAGNKEITDESPSLMS
ncbi:MULTISPECIES: DMT family transporter [Nocardia]|uniref:DMT family transporter n=1 Tax=Nocardia elegans TaxID=300029 RepID=A0ABW6T997_9NOCA|nr:MULTISPECIES: DMT family transporter [Nocardia]MBF6243795.1 DMT family transporter [Nocardia elegans]MBF6448831.1 DMT family transporter [Nocardia elegans]